MSVSVGARALRPACFVDRDGTVMADTHYPSDPDTVRLIPGVAEALAAVNARDVPVVIITNQGGIARGFLTESQYQAVRARLDALLEQAGVQVLDTYHCPHWEPVSGPCACRKPAPGMYRRAAADHDLDVTRSVYIGDRWRDVKPGLDLGGLGVLVPGPDTSDDDIARAREQAHVVPALRDAVDLFFASLGGEGARVR
jgi:D-glycero-D-manno-heptose 1,7-bisphosphate phosphatase